MNPDLSKLPLCDQDWNAMEPLGDGRRMCERCRHPVHDFRGMSKHEITIVHALSEGRVCGVYSPEHLAPVAPTEARRCRSGLVTLALGASLLAARADAQAVPAPAAEHAQLPRGSEPPSPSTEQTSQQASTPAANDTLVIRGRVRDAATGAPIASAVVMVAGRSGGAMTDTMGNYILRVRQPGDGELQLRFARIGYMTATATVRARDGEATADVRMNTAALLGLVGYVVAPSPEQQRT